MRTMKKKKKVKSVAVIGAGFAGLSCAYNLIKSGGNNDGVRVTLFASEKAGSGGASSIAAGLLHQRTPKGFKMPFGSSGYEKTLELLQKCQKIEEMMVDPDLRLDMNGIDFRFSGELRDVKREKMYRKIGCLKPARTEKDEIGMRKNVLNEGEDIRFVEREEIEVDLLRLRNKGEEHKEKDANNSCGFYVENGIVVNAQRYLEALKVLIEFEAAKNADADVSFAFRKHHVESLEEIMKRPNEFDCVVLCCGGEILRDGFLDESTKQELLEKAGGTLELQAGRALVLEREKCFVQEKWEMPGILGSHYLSPFQTTKAMFGPTKERGDKVKPEDAAKAGYYSTETAKSTLPDTQETIDFLMRELNEKVYPAKNGSPHFFSAKDIETIAYGVRVNGPRTHAGRFPKIVRFDNNRVFAVTAVGARGLLYHALLGEWVARTVLSSSTSFETIVPAEFR
tara:strand:- start:1783 stop:3141 length:1359 start_codon:yes stop_codon:yes gene_type:complete